MGIIGSSLSNNRDDYYNDGPRTISFDNPIINRTNNTNLCELISQGPNINIQKTSVVRNSLNLRRKTLKIINVGNNNYLINFIFDALHDVEVSIYFCCKEQLTEAKETIYYPTKYQTITKIFPKNLNQVYMSELDEGINLNNININDIKCKPSYEYIIPILIVLKAIGTPILQAQYNYAYLQENQINENKNNQDKYKIIIYRQKIQFGNRSFEVQEIFGIEKSPETKTDPVNNYLSGRECVICLTDERDTAILPCRHMCLCNVCANVVRMQNTKCPICRQEVQGLLQISIDKKDKNMNS